MEQEHKTLQQRISSGQVDKTDVVRRLAELAFGKVNDCVKLALEENPAVGRLDLSLLSEVKRNEKGMVEVKLIDRLKVLQQLADVMEGSDHQAEAFLRSLAPEQEQL